MPKGVKRGRSAASRIETDITGIPAIHIALDVPCSVLAPNGGSPK